MLCEKCGSEIENITCRQCGNVIMKLGDFCYLCGGRCVEPRGDLSEGTEAGDFNARILCSDGTCIGVIDEKGICKVCGKPYTSES